MELERQFEDKLHEAVLDEVEQTARDDLGPRLVAIARENWIEYATANDYDIEHIWEDAEGPIVERDDNRVQIRVEWPELTALFEWGVSPHTIEGDPLLHFYWDGADQWIQTESVNWGSETGGISEARAIRGALDQIRHDLSR